MDYENLGIFFDTRLGIFIVVNATLDNWFFSTR